MQPTVDGYAESLMIDHHSTLPATGIEILIVVAAAIVLISVGLLLRKASL
jgi:LPXTG-motif cell wall-anchored protein